MLSGNANIQAVPSGDELDEFVDFWGWLRKSRVTRFKIVGLVGIVVPLLATVYYFTGIIKNVAAGPVSITLGAPSIDTAMSVSYGAQIVVIFMILVLNVLLVNPATDSRFEYGVNRQHQLRIWWGVALVSFLLLYIFLWLRVLIHFRAKTNDESWLLLLDVSMGIVANLCNNLSTWAFLMCFSTMESSAVRAPKGDNHRWVLLWVGCLVMITFIESVIRFRYGVGVQSWNTDWFDLLTGANAGIALAMFVGRLSSPLINLPVSVTALLYLYAVVQISFGFWAKQPGVAIIMANACLVLKCLLSLVIAWALTTKHLIFYMERLHKTRADLVVARNGFRRRPLADATPASIARDGA